MISASPRRRAPRVPCHVPTHLRPWAYTCVLLNLLPSCLWARSPAATDPALHYDNAELRTPLARLLDSLLNPHDVTDPSAAPEMGGGGEETPEPSRLRRSARHPPRANPAMPTEPYLQWPRQPSPNDATAQLTRYLTTTTVPTPLAPDPMGDATCECATLDPHRRTLLPAAASAMNILLPSEAVNLPSAMNAPPARALTTTVPIAASHALTSPLSTSAQPLTAVKVSMLPAPSLLIRL